MRARARYLVGALLALMPAVAGLADNAPSYASLLKRGESAVHSKNYAEAITVFTALDSAASTASEHDIAQFSLAKALYYSGNLTDAYKAFQRHSQDFPSSPHIPHSRYFEGSIALLSGNHERACRDLIRAYLSGDDPRLETLSLTTLRRLFATNPNCALTVDSQITQYSGDKRCKLAQELSVTMLQMHRVADAAALRRLCADASGGGDAQNDSLTIAVLVPLSGELQEYGESIYLGGVTAAQYLAAAHSMPVRLLPFDTKGDPVTAGRLVRELQHTDVDAVVGPLTSDEAAVVAAALSCSDLPVVAPAASKSGISLLSARSFQMTPSLELQGVAIADYAIRTLRAKTAIVLAPAEADYISLTTAFVERFEKQGGSVIAKEYYLGRDKDFKNHIRSIKELIRGKTDDSTTYLNDRGDTLEVDAVPAEVDCLFLPGSPEQLRQLLPQINYYSLRGKYLGTDSWGDDAVLGLGDDVTKGAVFTSPFLRLDPTPIYTQFTTLYEGNFNSEPNRLATLGYDAVSLVAAAATRGMNRDALTRGLNSLSQFPGATGTISFSSWRENVILPLYQITEGKPIPVGISETTAGPGTPNR